VIAVHDLEVRIGARTLLSPTSFSVGAGDRVGLVGRNGSGKTTLTKILAGEGLPTAGTVSSRGKIGYLPQDPRTGNLDMLAIDRILSARELDVLVAKMWEAEEGMASTDEAIRDKAIERYGAVEERFRAAGGYAAES